MAGTLGRLIRTCSDSEAEIVGVRYTRVPRASEGRRRAYRSGGTADLIRGLTAVASERGVFKILTGAQRFTQHNLAMNEQGHTHECPAQIARLPNYRQGHSG